MSSVDVLWTTEFAVHSNGLRVLCTGANQYLTNLSNRFACEQLCVRTAQREMKHAAIAIVSWRALRFWQLRDGLGDRRGTPISNVGNSVDRVIRHSREFT
jgi:hypothetical protein